MPNCVNEHRLTAGASFCGVCGTDVRQRCTAGHLNDADAHFCRFCGTRLAAPIAGTAVSPAPAPAPVPVPDEPPWDAAPRPEAAPGAPGTPGTPGALGAPGAPFWDAAPRADDAPPWEIIGSPPRDYPPDYEGGGLAGYQADGLAGGLTAAPDPEPSWNRPAGIGPRGRRTHPGWGSAAVVAAIVVGAGAVMALVLTNSTSKPTVAANKRPASRQAASVAPAGSVGPDGWTHPAPIDRPPYTNDNASITAVSCVSAAACFAVDSDGHVLASSAMNSWRIVDTASGANLTSISCATAKFCAAVDSSGTAIVLSHGRWTAPVNIDAGNELNGVSCPTSAYCVAVDSQGEGFTFTGSATNWSHATIDPNRDTLSGVSCPTTDFCVVVDQAGNVYTFDGSSWTAGDSVDNGNEFSQISCASASFCAAVDNSGNAAVMSDGHWSTRTLRATAASVSCPADGYCVAVDGNGGALKYQHGSWSAETNIDGNNSFDAVSCAKENSCAATDQYDNVTYYMAGGAVR